MHNIVLLMNIDYGITAGFGQVQSFQMQGAFVICWGHFGTVRCSESPLVVSMPPPNDS